jgi:hypothetical protein
MCTVPLCTNKNCIAITTTKNHFCSPFYKMQNIATAPQLFCTPRNLIWLAQIQPSCGIFTDLKPFVLKRSCLNLFIVHIVNYTGMFILVVQNICSYSPTHNCLPKSATTIVHRSVAHCYKSLETRINTCHILEAPEDLLVCNKLYEGLYGSARLDCCRTKN